MKKILLIVTILLATLCVYSSIYAAGTVTKSGTAPNITQPNVEVQQAAMTFSGPLSTSTVKNVSYSFKHYRQCQSPLSGIGGAGTGCSWANVPVDTYLCGTSQIGVLYPASNRTVTDARCTPRLTSLSGSTGSFNGMPINNTTRRLRLYYVFLTYGSGTYNPPLVGQSNSATVSW